MSLYPQGYAINYMTTEQAIQQLQELDIKTRDAMRRGELKAAEIIANQAKAIAPGSLANKISIEQTENTTTIIGGDEFSAYVEFGTGIYAKEYVSTLPPEVREEAIKFFVTGKGHGSPHPFFFPAIFANQDKIIEFVNEELQTLAK